MNKHDETCQIIKAKLNDKFNPSHLEVIDESHLHVGHAGAKSGGGHFKVIIASTQLNNQSRIKAHRLIHAHLKDLFTNRIHALSIKIIP